MRNEESIKFPKNYLEIVEATKLSGFTMASDVLTGSLLRTLTSTKIAAKFLELGTGTGLSTSWILNGMDGESHLTSVDNNREYLDICEKYLGTDSRLTLACMDGEAWVLGNLGKKYDFIFADTWHGKYLLLDEVLTMLKPGGIYFIDDMLPQPNWPDGHAEKASKLLADLEAKAELVLTKLVWSTGIIICVKKG